MTQGFEVSIQLEENISRALLALVEAGEDLTPAMGEIARYMVSEIERRFESESGPGGVPWKKSKRAIDEGGQTLTLSGDLRRSMREDFGRDYAAAGPEASGGAAVYALVHQTGFHGPVVVPFHVRTVTERFGKKLDGEQTEYVSSYVRQMNLPARPYVGFEPDDGDEITAILRDHLGAAFGEAA